MNRNYSDQFDPDMSVAEFYGWPTPAELARDAAEDRGRRDDDVTGPLVDAVRAERWYGR